MQKSELNVFFTQDKEKAIAEFNTLWEIKPPDRIRDLKMSFEMDLKLQRTEYNT